MINKFGIYNNYYSWWKNIDKTILILVVSFFIAGLFFSLASTSLIASDRLNTNSYYFFVKHLSFILLGLLIMFIFSLIKEEFLIKVSITFFVISLFLLFLVPFIGAEVKGSKRWLDLPFLPRFQPVELIKPFYIVILASLLNFQKYNLYFKYFLSLLLVVPIVLLLISQPDLGQSMLIILTWLALIFVSGINLVIFFGLFGFFITIIFYLIFFVDKFNYIKIRITSFLDSSSNSYSQAEKASEAIINGGFFGKGIGEGTLNSKIPEAHTDFIISVISEEMGFFAVSIILFSLIWFIYWVIDYSQRIENNFISTLLIGLCSLIFMHVIINMAMISGLLPVTGLPVPFISYGGSFFLTCSIGIGLINNIINNHI